MYWEEKVGDHTTHTFLSNISPYFVVKREERRKKWLSIVISYQLLALL
jgi:hypothetical protein